MPDRSRRKELLAQYRASRPEAAVYLVRNTATGRSLLASTTNLASVRNRLEFAKSTGMPGALDQRLRKDAGEFGIEVFSLDVVEILEVEPGMTDTEVAADLATLESLWREKLGTADLY